MKEAISSHDAPKPIGPYSQAMRAGNMFFTAGQIAIDPSSGEVVKTDIKSETDLVMKNLQALLNAAGLGFEDVVKCSIFLSDMNHFASVNEVYARYFEAPYPVRETVEVSRLPKDVNVEISLIAIQS